MTDAGGLRLEWIPGLLAVCRLDADAPLPAWMLRELERANLKSLVCVARSDRELSIVCDESIVPAGIHAERGFAALRVAGVLDFSLTGIIAQLTAPLAEAGVPVFVVSTFETDYLLVRSDQRAVVRDALRPWGLG